MEKRINAEVDRPEAFLRRMAALLGDDFPAFAHSFSEPARYGLRANLLKVTPETLAALLPFSLSPVAWCGEGFIFPEGVRPAKSWAYHAGLFYIQEPSAMGPAVVLDAQPGDRVLDICAAPGGKSAQLAGQLQGKGVLVANDTSASRCNALIRNLEMAGVTNAVVLNEQPKRLAERFPCYFDRILVDAPCSGEGMFRRDPDAVKGWAENKPEACVRMQREILHFAAAMLKPGGRLVYSTCTFSPDENEAVIEAFLAANPDFELLPIDHQRLGMAQAMPEWVGARDTLRRAARVWPHRAAGEGHFIAGLERKLSNLRIPLTTGYKITDAGKNKSRRGLNPLSLFTRFAAHYLDRSFDGGLVWHERSLFAIPAGLPDLSGLRVARGGWYLGDAGKDRFTPSQALAMGLAVSEARYTVSLKSEETERYLKGETLSLAAQPTTADGEKPWVLVTTQGYPLGWGRWVDGRLKNARPPGWAVR